MDNTPNTNRTAMEKLENKTYYRASLAWIPNEEFIVTYRGGFVFAFLLSDPAAGPLCFPMANQMILDGLLILDDKIIDGDKIPVPIYPPNTRRWLQDQRMMFQKKFKMGLYHDLFPET